MHFKIGENTRCKNEKIISNFFLGLTVLHSEVTQCVEFKNPVYSRRAMSTKQTCETVLLQSDVDLPFSLTIKSQERWVTFHLLILLNPNVIFSPSHQIDKSFLYSQRWREDSSISLKLPKEWKFWQTFLSYWLRQNVQEKENEFPQKQLKIPKAVFTNLIYKFNSFPINRKDPVRK